EALFWQMSRRDQHHAIAVSIKAERLARHRGVWDGAEIRTLIRAGLLHDIGRVRGEVGIHHKVLYVLVKRLRPRWAVQLAREGEKVVGRGGRLNWGDKLRRAFFTQTVHPDRGAAMARLWGIEADVERLIRLHHRPQRDDRLLQVFVEADK